MEKISLKVALREANTRSAKNLYKQGQIPAQVYGHNISNIHLSVNLIDFTKVLRKAGESTIISLSMPDGKERNVLIQDVQVHYLSSKPIHVDFLEVNMSEEITATVPIEFIGESMAVKALGGTLVKVLSEVEVECLPGDLPQHFEVDIAKLTNFDQVLTVADIPVGGKVKIMAESDEVVAKVQPPRDMEAELSSTVDEAAAVAAAVGPEEKPVEEEKK